MWSVLRASMLPFNRERSITVGYDTDDVEGRSFLANILELSQLDLANGGEHNRHTVSKLKSPRSSRRSVDSNEFLGLTRGSQCVSQRLRVVFLILRCLAFFPVLNRRSNRQKRRLKHILSTIFLVHMSVMALVLNGYLFKSNFDIIMIFTKKFGLMHASTVSSIISGIKPAINVMLLFTFLTNLRSHIKLIKRLDALDMCFRSAFQCSPSLFCYALCFTVSSLMVFFIPLFYRIFDFHYNNETLNSTLTMVSFFLVPLLSLWNLVPLFYYHLNNLMVRFYCAVLIKVMNKEHDRRHFSLKFYYEQFLRITGVQEAIGELFNPFLLFSLFWSLVILCLAIYFIVQPASSLVEPLTVSQVGNDVVREMLTKRVHTSMGWAALQVFVALLNIVIISHTGMKTNEITRQIVNAVLRIVPDENADLDRFQISCFVHKMSTQFMWGMTVWRAFPLERSTFFTVKSVENEEE